MSGLQENTKSLFRSTVNAIRERLLEDLSAACYQRYSLNAKDRSKVQLTWRDEQDYQRLQAWLKDPNRFHKEWETNLGVLIKERAYTLTNRLVILMQLECRGLRKVKLISQGVEKSAFKTVQEFFVALTQGDDLGFSFMLQQVWDQLALELPALFEYNEYHECVPVPGTTLLWMLQQLNNPDLDEAWRDDTTLGWLYQYWNDPDRKAIDEKLNTTTGKVEAHELAAKTQLFTERYMVEWLVQNSLGSQWLAICKKRGWIPKAQELLAQLQIRRGEWNRKISLGEIEETVPLPVHGDEEFWKFYVPQEIPEETVAAAPQQLQDVKMLDPAMGSGHFLVYLFDFLWELYHDQARLLGEMYSDEQIITWILENNLHGIDIDNRAVQIGAAALYIKAHEKKADYHIQKMNLVATDLGLGHLKKDDPAVVSFAENLQKEIGIPKKICLSVIECLQGAEYLGSLLPIDEAINKLVEETRLFGEDIVGSNVKEMILNALKKFIHDHDNGEDLGVRSLAEQLGKGLRLIDFLSLKFDIIIANPPYLGAGKVNPDVYEKISAFDMMAKGDLFTLFMSRTDKLRKSTGYSAFVNMHSWMFLSTYDEFRKRSFNNCFYNKVAHLGRGGGFQDWADFDKVMQTTMFIWCTSKKINKTGWYCRLNSYTNYQKCVQLLRQNPKDICNFPQSRFSEIPGAPMIYWWPEEFRQAYLKADKLLKLGTPRHGMTTSNNNRFLRQSWEVGKQSITVSAFDDNCYMYPNSNWVPYVKGAGGQRWYEDLSNVLTWRKNGLEVKQFAIMIYNSVTRTIQNQDYYFYQGLAFSYIGTNGFLCRLRKYKSIFDVSGSSIFCTDPEKMQVILSSNLSGYVSQSLNPTVNNQVGDIANLPVFDLLADHTQYLKRAKALYDQFFASAESNLEYTYQKLSIETFEVEEARIRDEIDKEILQHFSEETARAIYKEIGESPFNYPHWDNQDTTIPADFAEVYQKSESVLELCHHYRLHPDSILQIKEHLHLIHTGQRKDDAFKHLSWAIGVLLGRFDAQTGGLTDLASERLKENNLAVDLDAPKAHPHGLLYLSALDFYDNIDRKQESNTGEQCLQTLMKILTYKWGTSKAEELWLEITDALVLDCKTDWTAAQKAKKNLNDWIRCEAFALNEIIYQGRPIYFPLVSEKKNFFIWVNIHQWNDGTLNSILANYVKPDITVLDSRIRRLREERQSTDDKKVLNTMEKEIADLDKLLEELKKFTEKIVQLATRGPAPTTQEVEAPYVMDLDDGVMVNSAALWELLLPLWKKPKEWWKSLSTPAGKKDFDWSHLAMRYWPKRAMEKVKKDPSLAVAHSDYGIYKGRDLFEELHPKAAEKWREQQGQVESEPEPELELGV
jgi:hypothetical protein